MTDDQKEFPFTLVCGFCGQHERGGLPVKLERDFKLTRGCGRCTIKGRKGERVRFEPTRTKSTSIVPVMFHENVYTVARARQWQHGTHVWLEGHHQTFDLMDFTPEKYEPSDCHRVRLKLIALGAEFVKALALFHGCLLTAWVLDGSGIIFAFNGEHVALYDYVGEPGGSVEQDLRYLEERHRDALELREVAG